MRNASPLRYPGGKWRLAKFFERLIELNGLKGRRYIEPYAGGGSLALSLLIGGHVSEIHLNDLDPAIHAFWSSALNHNRALCDMIRTADVTPDERARQKLIFAKGKSAGALALGFATFFLNRTNHSGILNGGIIGGREQTGQWRVDARFNKTELARRVQRVGQFKHRITITGIDGVELLRKVASARDSLVYVDPPYYRAGAHLYLNAYKPEDHAEIQETVNQLRLPWIVSYDDVPEIRKLYCRGSSLRFELLHSARSSKTGREILFFSPKMRIPRMK